MSRFRFIHAGDLHLDSPLIGLSHRSRDVAQRIDDASRRAFNSLISLAVEEECSFVLFAGDLFDGNWRDYRTGLFFIDGMRRLRDANIPAFVILGNHDAENKFVSRLKFAENVHLFSHRKAETRRIDELHVAIHGRSFSQRDVVENLALTYPAPFAGDFNIGLLHTACTGREGHESYAPCTMEQLANHGYEYWALGHVHGFEVLRTNPYIVYSGNLQGRQARENGPKGAVLVSVDDSLITNVELRALDAVRWAGIDVDVSGFSGISSAEDSAKSKLKQVLEEAGDRSVAARVRFTGTTTLHRDLLRRHSEIYEEIQTVAADLSPDIWIEKLMIETLEPPKAPLVDPTIEGRMKLIVNALAADSSFASDLESKLAELKTKIPAGARVEELMVAMRKNVPDRALNIAVSNMSSSEQNEQ